jgi:D-hexose-6-phosphate mutarotase
MRAEEFAAEFGIVGILDFVETEHGLVKATISLDGMAGELYLQGAQLTAWQPSGEQPVLFTSPTARLHRAEQFGAAFRSSSRGSAPVRMRQKRHSTALRVPQHGISTRSRASAASP